MTKMLFNKQKYIFIEKTDKKNLIIKLWQEFLFKDTYLISEKKDYVNSEVHGGKKLSWLNFVINVEKQFYLLKSIEKQKKFTACAVI